MSALFVRRTVNRWISDGPAKSRPERCLLYDPRRSPRGADLQLEVNGEMKQTWTMTYYEAALKVLRSVQRPLTTREITDLALAKGLIKPIGKTPHATMAARLYLQAGKDPELVKLEEPGNGRAKRGSVHWTVRHASATDPERAN